MHTRGDRGRKRARVSGAVATLALGVSLLMPATASAQEGPYVAVSGGVNVTRVSHAEGPGLAPIGDGESGMWALRLGLPLGGRWGVDLEYARSLQSDDEQTLGSGGAVPVRLGGGTVQWSSDGPIVSTGGGLFPAGLGGVPFEFRVRTRERHASIAPSVWFKSELSPRVAVVFLGGVAFNRTDTETTASVSLPPSLLAAITLPAAATTIEYGTSALAGVEGRIGLTDHVVLIPAVRMQGLADGWSVRPTVGLGWQF